jgi:hypothetical protein
MWYDRYTDSFQLSGNTFTIVNLNKQTKCIGNYKITKADPLN